MPGFEDLGTSGSPSLPVKRTWLEAVAGRGVRVAAVRAFDLTSEARPGAGVFPASAARVIETGFQEDVKKALLELAPLRWNGASGELLWARRLQVRLAFAGVERSERSLGDLEDGGFGRRRTTGTEAFSRGSRPREPGSTPGSKSFPFTLGAILDREAKLEVYLQAQATSKARRTTTCGFP